MLSLLIDNDDSFTYNLFHYLAEVNGEEPVVIEHHDPSFSVRLLDDFDNVVLSPGPGSPDRPADFGVCAEVLADGGVPVLGVCLGHQGLAYAHGGQVRPAPEVRHGRSSPICHDGTGLFAGLPSPLEVIRYHSLEVAGLPPELEVTAHAPDGVVMALRHRTLPQWGMQFHPESIGTAGGHAMLRNFGRMSRAYNTGAGRRRRPARAIPVRRDESPVPVRRLRVLTRRLATGWDPEVVFDRLFSAGDHAFWLDGEHRGDSSIMGDASGPLARIAEADVTTGTVAVTGRAGTTVVREPFFEWLDRDLRSLSVDLPDRPYGFVLGWVGALGYELKAECGAAAAHRSPIPDATMVFADRAIVFDHRAGVTTLLALAEDGDERAARAWLRETTVALGDLAGRSPEPPRPLPVVPENRLRLRDDRVAYLDLIAACQDEIRAGETYEVCLTTRVTVDAELDPWHAYRLLRRASPAPYGAYLSFGRMSVLSTSPERFLRIGRDGWMEAKPIKGTRPRGRTDAEDALFAADLATSVKDRAENMMIVDLVRHDVGRSAVVGSVEADPFQVETFATAHQLVSTVRGRLRPGTSAVAAARAAFPPGSMTGAPKSRTMSIIDRLESGPRGVYSGSIGYFSLDGTADLSVVIRTLVMTGGEIGYGVGGAVIALSDPAAEFDEILVKAIPLLRLTGSGRITVTTPTVPALNK